MREAYLNWLFEETSRIYLTGVDPQAKGKASSALNLSAVYTALLTQTPQKEADRFGEVFLEKTKHISALEQLDRYPRLVLMGDPGGGKSTFVNFVVMCLASESMKMKKPEATLDLLTAPLPDDEGKPVKERQPWNQGVLLPVRIILRDFAASGLLGPTAGHLWRFIQRELEIHGHEAFYEPLHRELVNRGGLILLDGLDEVPELESRPQIKQAVEDFAKANPQCRILVTSRTYAYQKQDWKLTGFAEAILIPFSDGQIRHFIDCWYTHTAALIQKNEHWAHAGAEALKQAIFKSDRLHPLAQRPLLLTLMASLHAWRSGRLPDKREQLYEETMNLLFDFWETSKKSYDANGREIIQPSISEFLKIKDKEKLLDVLCELAYNAHRDQPETTGAADIPEGDLLIALKNLAVKEEEQVRAGAGQNGADRIDITLLAEYLQDRAGLLLPRGNNIYTFPHRTFQEYLTARYLSNYKYPYELAKLVKGDPNRWREVALLAGAKAGRGTQSAIWSLINALCYDPEKTGITSSDSWAALIAGQLLTETIDLKDIPDEETDKVERIRKWQLRIMNSELPAIERVAAGRTLAQIGDPREAVMGLDKMEFCWVPAGPFWMGSKIGGDEKLYLNQQLNYNYWNSRYPVTNAQFAVFVNDGGYNDPTYWNEAKQAGVWLNGKVKGWRDSQYREKPYDYGEPFNLKNHPVVGVTWFETLAFTRWLTQKWLKEGRIAKDREVKLPSEAEWEKAARGGEYIPERFIIGLLEDIELKQDIKSNLNPQPQRNYPWGGADKCEPDLANFAQTGIGSTNAAGCFPRGVSPYGVEELRGNVWEWTRSVYTKYLYDPNDGREDLNSKDARVLRGGSWSILAEGLRSSYRFRYYPVYRDNLFGFRVVFVAWTH
ncbi:MAG: SUMF1/EgtB/PvdO family nonheme iron enzyme [Firmicutes bacterium]|nr:SUMF1/EgtB/PvdO family nonheme iron enzyme [Bacillota bacterium]